MAATLQYDLAVIGRAVVERELATLERRFAQHARTLNRTTGMGAGTGSRPSGSAAASADRSAQKAIRDRLKMETDLRRMQATLAREKLAGERAASQAQKRTAAEQQRAIDRQVRSQQALARQRVKEERAVAAEHRRTTAARVEFVKSTVGGGARRVVGGLTSVGAAGAGMLGIAGAGLAAASVSSAVRLDEGARRFAIAGRGKGEAGMDPDAVRREVSAAGLAEGIAPERVMSGVRQFQADTGNSKVALGMAPSIAKFAQATDAAPEEVASAAASLFSNFNVKTIEELNDALARLTMQGKLGSFEFKGMAGQLSRITANFAGRGVGKEALPEIGAMAQIIKKGTGSDEVTTTALDAFFRQIISKSGELQSGEMFAGRKVQVFKDGDAKKGLRSDIGALVGDVMSASRGDTLKLQKLFGDEGMKGAGLFAATFQRASQSAGGGAKGAEAGRSAVLSMISEFSTAPADMSEINRDAASARESTAVQFEMAMSRLKDAVGTQLLPEITRLIPQLAELTPHVTALVQSLIRFTGFLANNPWTGLGLAVTAAIVAEIAKAGASKAIGSALAGLLGGRGGGLPGIGGAVAVPAGARGLLTAKGGAATAAAAIGVGMAIDQASSFMDENGGWEGTKSFLGFGKGKGWGFDGLDDYMNQQARAEAALRAPGEVAQAPAREPAVPFDAASANAELLKLQEAAAAANAALAAFGATAGGTKPNTGDKPTGIK